MFDALKWGMVCFFMCLVGFAGEQKIHEINEKKEAFLVTVAKLSIYEKNANQQIDGIEEVLRTQSARLEEWEKKSNPTEFETKLTEVLKKQIERLEEDRGILRRFSENASSVVAKALAGGIITRTSYRAFVSANTLDEKAVSKFLADHGIKKGISKSVSSRIVDVVKKQGVKKSLATLTIASAAVTSGILLEEAYGERLGWWAKVAISLVASLGVFLVVNILL